MKNVLKICKIICNEDAHVLNIHLLTSVLPMMSAGGRDRAIIQHKPTRHTMKERVEQMTKALDRVAFVLSPHRIYELDKVAVALNLS